MRQLFCTKQHYHHRSHHSNHNISSLRKNPQPKLISETFHRRKSENLIPKCIHSQPFDLQRAWFAMPMLLSHLHINPIRISIDRFPLKKMARDRKRSRSRFHFLGACSIQLPSGVRTTWPRPAPISWHTDTHPNTLNGRDCAPSSAAEAQCRTSNRDERTSAALGQHQLEASTRPSSPMGLEPGQGCPEGVSDSTGWVLGLVPVRAPTCLRAVLICCCCMVEFVRFYRSTMSSRFIDVLWF